VDYVGEIINILIGSFILAYILRPIKNQLLIRCKIKDTTASIIIIMVIVAIIIISFYIMIPRMFNEINNSGIIIDKVSMYIEDFRKNNSPKNSDIMNYIYDVIQEKGTIILEDISAKVISGLISISEKLISFAVVPVVTYYFLSDSKMVINRFYKLVPIKNRNITKKIIYDADKLLGKYILSQIILSLIIAVFTFIILTILNIKFAIWLSLLNGILNIIPYFGPIFGMIPIIFIALLDSPTTGIWAGISMIVIQQIEGNILSPKITGDSINMHPIYIIILLLIGEAIGGFVGMILAVPIGVIIKVIYEDINYYLF
jgi:predicted PurR-regulated permease PerM